MWLLVVQIALAIIAGLRGWKWIPILILLGAVVFGFLMGAGFGTDVIPILSVVDYGSIAAFLIMAIVGKKKAPPTQTNNLENVQPEYRVKCPYCSELILPDAKVCRYCGKDLTISAQ